MKYRPSSDRAAILAAFVALVVIGGSNAVAVRFGNVELAPFWGASLRFGAAALISWLIVLVRRIPLPRGRMLVGVALYGLLGTGLSYAFLYWALLRVPASFTMVVLAFVPLITLFLASVHRLESLSWRKLIGALVGIAGILIVVGGGLSTELHVGSLIALFLAAACIAEGSVVLKLMPPLHPLAVNAVALTSGAAALFGLSLLFGENRILPATVNTWVALLYLVVLGSVVLFSLYLFVLTRWTASATAYSFLLFPVATVPLAALLLGEEITVTFLLGGALGLFGVWFGSVGGLRRATAARVSPVDQG